MFHPAVKAMVDILCDANDKCLTLGVDLVHGYIHYALKNGLPLPNLEDNTFWKFAMSYTEKRSNCSRSMNPDLVEAFTSFVNNSGRPNDTPKSIKKDLFEAIGTQEATNNKLYNSYDTLLAHTTTYLRGKYQIKYKGWAQAIARRVLSSEPNKPINNKVVEVMGMHWVLWVVNREVTFKGQIFGENPFFCPVSKLKYRYFMMNELDIINKTQEDEPVKSLTLIPTHACGGSHPATIQGAIMENLLPWAKSRHKDFYDYIKGLPKDQHGKLTSYFYMPKLSKGWEPAGSFMSDGVELHCLFVKNKLPKSLPQELKDQGFARKDFTIDSETYWELPKEVIQEDDPTNIVAVDKGFHNFYASVRFTGEYKDNGERVFEKRRVTKKWFDQRSGRTAMRKKHAMLSKRVSKKGLLEGITNHTLKTVNTEAIFKALSVRASSYETIHSFYNNKRIKKFKFAMRKREQKAIDEAIQYITYGGKATVVFGDCSKTTGFKSSTPGGPLKKMEHKMVKTGLRVCEENESMSTKSSLCCHGHHNKKMPNGQDPKMFKNGNYKYYPDEVHGILICKKCGRTWDRDFVGAVNILDIYMARMNGLTRPQRFRCRSLDKLSNISMST